MPQTKTKISQHCWLWLILTVVAAVLAITTVPGVFITDENHHLVTVRAYSLGRLTLPDYDGLHHTASLGYFDPLCRSRKEGFTSTTVPPLYGVMALPLYPFGWRGLVFMNTLAFVLCGALVFAFTRRFAKRPFTPWLALAAYILAGHSIEYAQGVWPHMLSAALCTGSVYLASRVRDGAPLVFAALSGLLAGLATGVRYQNILVAGFVGLGIGIWAQRRLVTGGAYLAGLIGPLLANSVFNHLRLGSWNPISKGSDYLVPSSGKLLGNPIVESLAVLWAKIVDFSFHPPLGNTVHEFETIQHPDPETGAYLLLGIALKKAWLQSSPWILLSLALMMLAWFVNKSDGRQRRELKSMSLIVGGVLGAFAVAGFSRHDGMCFNQRYFLDLVPLAAVALAWAVERYPIRATTLLAGVLSGLLLALFPLLLWEPENGLRQLLLLKLPLVLAGLLFLGWLLSRWAKKTWLLPFFLGACLSWSLVVHVGEDLNASRTLRQFRARQQQAMAEVLPQTPAAAIAYWGNNDALWPLQIDHDLVISNPWINHGRDLRQLIDELLAVGRRVFVMPRGMPKEFVAPLTRGRRVRQASTEPFLILEVANPQPGN